MKGFVLTLVALCFSSTLMFAQFKKGDIEWQSSMMIGSNDSKAKYTAGSYSSEDAVTMKFFMLTFIAGFYLADGFSFEPEIMVLALERRKPAQYLLGNLSYTYLVPNSRVAPFLRVGYGVSNSLRVPGFGNELTKFADKFDINVLNLSGGVKYLVSKSAALTAELNYRNHTYFHTSATGSTTDYTWTNIGMLFGFSVIL